MMSVPSATTQTRPDSAPATAAEDNGRVSVIVPIYNEVAHVEELLQAIEASPVRKEISRGFRFEKSLEGETTLAATLVFRVATSSATRAMEAITG